MPFQHFARPIMTMLCIESTPLSFTGFQPHDSADIATFKVIPLDWNSTMELGMCGMSDIFSGGLEWHVDGLHDVL